MLAVAEYAAEPVDYLLVKLAARCNLDCTYCYWFRDPTVYDSPNRLTPEAEFAFLERLREHIAAYRLRRFGLLFHGGEPLLFGKQRFSVLIDALRALSAETGCSIPMALTTNGTLIDDEWAELLKVNGVSVTVSVDGPKHINDRFRLLLKGGGSHDLAMRGISYLRAAGMDPGILAVYSPGMSADEIVRYFVQQKLLAFNVLIPDATHDSPQHATDGVGEFFSELFEIWWTSYRDEGVDISFCTNVIRGLVTGNTGTESFGHGPMTTATLMPNGDLEPLDVTRITGAGSTRTAVSVLRDPIQAIRSDPLWLRLLDASLRLHTDCERCDYRSACGGGHIASRWGRGREYDNPSVHCAHLKTIFGRAWQRIYPSLEIVRKGKEPAC